MKRKKEINDIARFLDSIEISSEEKKLIKQDLIMEKVVDFIGDTNLLTKFIKKFLSFSDNYQKKIKERKVEILLESLFIELKENHKLLEALLIFLMDSKGYYLFYKSVDTTREIDENSLNLNKKIVLYLINTNYNALFDMHNYCLTLLGRLSQISIKILLDKNNWPKDISGSTFQVGDMIITNWEKRFVEKYSNIVKIDYDILLLSIFELRDNRILEYSIKDNKRNIYLTNLGNQLIEYIRK